jgi:hypothetical protein
VIIAVGLVVVAMFGSAEYELVLMDPRDLMAVEQLRISRDL